MFTHTWGKYLPIIKILLKRSQSAEQTFSLNVSDFQNKGAKKGGEKFAIQFSKGKAGDMIRSSVMAKDLAAVLLADPAIHDLFSKNEYHISMNSKFQLSIQCIPAIVEEDI
jgi:hypothetical protein